MTNRETAFNKPQFGAKMPSFDSRPKASDFDLQNILREDAPLREDMPLRGSSSYPPLRQSPALAPSKAEPVTDWSDLEAEIAAFSSAKPKTSQPEPSETQSSSQFTTRSGMRISKSYSPAEIYENEQELETYKDAAPARSQRSGAKTIASVLGIALVAGLGIFGYRAITGSSSSEPKVIRASETPNKEVVPQTQQASNKGVMDRAAPSGAGTVVPRDEKPLTGSQQAEQTNVDENAPRKVRTISISSDGQGGVISRPTVAGMNTLPIAPNVNVGNAPARSVRTQPVAVEAAPQPKPVAQTLPAAKTTTPPVEKPKAAAVATVKPPANLTNTNTPLALGPKAAASSAVAGSFAVQVASAKTEGEAKSTFKSMQGKYDSLEGKSPAFIKADGDAGAFYRVRVNAGTKEKATELCAALKGEGGNCFVVKN